MRELSACDFCGDTAAGVYEVVPGDVSGVSSRRMVLCDGCRDTLATVVDPLLDAIPDDTAGGGGTSDATDHVDSEVPGPATEPAAEPESSSAPERESTAEPEPERESESKISPGPESEPSPEREREPEPSSASGADEQQKTTESESPSKPEPTERPEGYGKVVRLVENRDEGITRRDLEELASGAYDLRPSEVEEAIEFAVERGTFAETDSGLETT